MSIVDDLADLFSDTVVITPGYTDDFGGWVASGQVRNFPCRIEGHVQLIKRSDGQDQASALRVIFGGYPNLDIERDRFTLPTRFSPKTNLKAINIEKVFDEETGTDGLYEEVVLPP